jgi:uncharacterized protein YjdB
MRNPVLKRFLAGVAVLGALGWSAACSSDSSTEAHVHAVELIKVTPEVDTTLVGQTVQFAVTATCHCGDTLTDRTVTWQSSNPAVALVSPTGLVTGVSRGTAVIDATSEGVSGLAGISVLAIVDGVTIEPAVVTLDIGETAQLTAALRDPDGNVLNRPIVWGSDNPTVVAVDANGMITALATGTVNITATSEGKVGAAAITVRVAVNSVEVTPAEAAVSVGGTLQLTATPRDAGGAPLERPVAWTSADPAIATVNATGLVSAVATGEVTISATSQGKAGGARITVRVPVASVTISDPGEEPVPPGGTLQLTAAAFDATGAPLAGRTFIWSSSDNAIATVDHDGLVTGVARGTATITVMSEGKSASTSVRVAGEVTTVGNNLSYPVVFTEGIGLTGLAVTTDPGVRPTAAENILVDQLPFWYAGNVADYNGTYYLQQGTNTWQAEWLDGSTAGMQQAEVAWGDNLTGVEFNTHQNIRIEVVLNDLGGRQLSGFNMTALYGTGETEMQGTDGTTALFTPTLYSVMPRIIIEKLDDTTREPVQKVFEGTIYDAFGGDGPGSFTAEVNVAGKLIYGYNLMIQQLTFPSDLHKYGWWRVTFQLDDNGQVGGGPVTRNISLAALSAGAEGRMFPPHLDQARNVTWVDFNVKSASGGGGGGH